jgi:hypothetical protein
MTKKTKEYRRERNRGEQFPWYSYQAAQGEQTASYSEFRINITYVEATFNHIIIYICHYDLDNYCTCSELRVKSMSPFVLGDNRDYDVSVHLCQPGVMDSWVGITQLSFHISYHAVKFPERSHAIRLTASFVPLQQSMRPV